MDDEFKNSFEALAEKVRRQVEPISATLKSLQDNSALGQIQKIVEQEEERMRALTGPLADLRKYAALDLASPLSRELDSLQKLAITFEERFKLPDLGETSRLFREFENESATLALARFAEPSASLREAIESLRTPWLDLEDQIGSIRGFAELQSIGSALDAVRTFDPALTEALRFDLGDWRNEIDWPKGIFDDPVSRSEFYRDLGLNTDLTAFPTAAFDQSINIAKLTRELPAAPPLYSPEPERHEDEVEAAFERTNAAHDRLQRLETLLRKFIDEQMTNAFGTNWVKHRVPGDMRKKWIEKREKAPASDVDWQLIAYADFTDYVQIITRSDNWSEVFHVHFDRQESVRESFQRLYPIRVCTMHARLISHDDELYLYVETKRLLKAIGVNITW